MSSSANLLQPTVLLNLKLVQNLDYRIKLQQSLVHFLKPYLAQPNLTHLNIIQPNPATDLLQPTVLWNLKLLQKPYHKIQPQQSWVNFLNLTLLYFFWHNLTLLIYQFIANNCALKLKNSKKLDYKIQLQQSSVNYYKPVTLQPYLTQPNII